MGTTDYGSHTIEDATSAAGITKSYVWKAGTRPLEQTPPDRSLIPRPAAIRNDVQWISRFDSAAAWTATGATTSWADDTSEFALGSQCCRLTISGASATATLSVGSSPGTFDTTAQHFVMWVRSPDITKLGSITLIFSNNSGYTAAYRWYKWPSPGTEKSIRNNVWTPVVFTAYDASSNVGSPTRTSITHFRIQVASVAAGNLDLQIGGLGMIPEPASKFPNGVITFTFDDGYDSIWSDARRLMDKYGFPGVSFITADRVGAAGRMTLAQLQTLQDRHGWEIGGHAATEANQIGRMTALTPAELDVEMSTLKTYMRSNGFWSDAYCYPGGEQNDDVVAAVSRYFSTACDTAGGPNAPGFLNRHMLTRTSILAANYTTVIPGVKANRLWQINYGHKIGTGGQSVADFTTIVDAIATEGVEVLTIQQVLDRMAAA